MYNIYIMCVCVSVYECRLNFKACLRYILFFHQMISLQKLRKMLFNTSKKRSSFRSRDIQFFIIFSLPFNNFHIHY